MGNVYNEKFFFKILQHGGELKAIISDVHFVSYITGVVEGMA